MKFVEDGMVKFTVLQNILRIQQDFQNISAQQEEQYYEDAIEQLCNDSQITKIQIKDLSKVNFPAFTDLIGKIVQKTQVKRIIIKKYFMDFEKIKTIFESLKGIDLSQISFLNCVINAQQLESVLKLFTSSLKQLQLKQCFHITTLGLCEIFQTHTFPLLLKLIFHDLLIDDQILKTLKKTIKMEQLKTFQFSENFRISQSAWRQFFRDMPNLNLQKINLNKTKISHEELEVCLRNSTDFKSISFSNCENLQENETLQVLKQYRYNLQLGNLEFSGNKWSRNSLKTLVDIIQNQLPDETVVFNPFKLQFLNFSCVYFMDSDLFYELLSGIDMSELKQVLSMGSEICHRSLSLIFKNAHNLQTLSLNRCRNISGSEFDVMFEQLETRKNLQKLYLWNTKVTDRSLQLIIEKFPNIKRLQLVQCYSLTSKGFKSLFRHPNFKNIRKIDVEATKLDDQSIVEFKNDALISFNISQCPLLTVNGIRCFLENNSFDYLTKIRFKKSDIDDECLKIIAQKIQPHQFQRINLFESQCFSSRGLGSILKHNFPKLREVSFSKTKLEDPEIISLSNNSKNLVYIDISECTLLTSQGLDIFAKQSCLQNVNIFYMHDSGADDSFFRIFVDKLKSPVLYRLSISRNNKVKAISFCWLFESPNFLNLEDIFISCSQIDYKGLELLGNNCQFLRSLAISDCKRLQEQHLQAFFQACNLRNLEIIYLYRTQITDEAFKALLSQINQMNLREMSLVGCQYLSKEVLLSLFKDNDLLSLESLYINSLGINDEILYQIGRNFRSMRVFDMTDNPLITESGLVDFFKIADFKNLEDLFIGKVQLKQESLKLIAQQISREGLVKKLYISDSQFQMNIGQDLRQQSNFFKECRNLEIREFYLSDSQLDDDGLSSILGLFPYIKTLELNRCQAITERGFMIAFRDSVYQQCIDQLDVNFTKIGNEALSYLKKNFQLSKLRILSISYCSKITKKGFSFIFENPSQELAKLEELSLEGSNADFDSLKNLYQISHNLRLLNLSQNSNMRETDFENLFTDLNLQNIQSLFLSSNKLNDACLEKLSNQIRYNQVDKKNSEEIDQDTCTNKENRVGGGGGTGGNLKQLSLSSCRDITDQGFANFFRNSEISCLEDLYMYSTNVGDLCMKEIAQFGPNLKNLDLQYCTLIVNGMEIFTEFAQDLRQLQFFYITKGLFSEKAMEYLGQKVDNYELRDFSIGDCVDASPNAIFAFFKNCNLMALETLFLYRTKVEGDILKAIYNSTRYLRLLDFEFCQEIEGETLSEFFQQSQFKNLEKLYLSKCNINDACILSIKKNVKLNKLQNLSFGNCDSVAADTLAEFFSEANFASLNELFLYNTQSDKRVLKALSLMKLENLQVLDLCHCNDISFADFIEFLDSFALSCQKIKQIKIVQKPTNHRELIKSSWQFRGILENDRFIIGLNNYMNSSDAIRLASNSLIRQSIEEIHIFKTDMYLETFIKLFQLFNDPETSIQTLIIEQISNIEIPVKSISLFKTEKKIVLNDFQHDANPINLEFQLTDKKKLIYVDFFTVFQPLKDYEDLEIIGEWNNESNVEEILHMLLDRFKPKKRFHVNYFIDLYQISNLLQKFEYLQEIDLQIQYYEPLYTEMELLVDINCNLKGLEKLSIQYSHQPNQNNEPIPAMTTYFNLLYPLIYFDFGNILEFNPPSQLVDLHQQSQLEFSQQMLTLIEERRKRLLQVRWVSYILKNKLPYLTNSTLSYNYMTIQIIQTTLIDAQFYKNNLL